MMKIIKRTEMKDLFTLFMESISQLNESGDPVGRLKDTAEAIQLYESAPVECKKAIDAMFALLTKKSFGTLQRESLETFRRQQELVDNISNLMKLSDDLMYGKW